MIEHLRFKAWEFDGFEDDEILIFPLNYKFGKDIRETFYYKIYLELVNLKVNETICKKELIMKIYGRYDEFIDDSFRVHLCRARKMTLKKFKGDKLTIKRIF